MQCFLGKLYYGQTHTISVMTSISCQHIDLACLTSLKIQAELLYWTEIQFTATEAGSSPTWLVACVSLSPTCWKDCGRFAAKIVVNRWMRSRIRRKWSHAGLNRGPFGYWPNALTNWAMRPMTCCFGLLPLNRNLPLILQNRLSGTSFASQTVCVCVCVCVCE